MTVRRMSSPARCSDVFEQLERPPVLCRSHLALLCPLSPAG